MYIGGSAGTGKTVLLRVLCKRLQAHRLRVAMTATTGVAGCHISGSTFHHAFGVSSRGEFLRRHSLLEYDVIVIDEVSMFSKRLFDDFDKVLRDEAGTPDLPFGGIQIILCGDFLQLGCINEGSLICSQLFHNIFVKLRLHTQVRQTANSQFAHDLQVMRLG
uniref:ATP-dependent DNA helicase n=1 Tax=Lygus hesperus TaxID=30085 RepID=A0A0A9YTL0_LYGHE